jgi:ABC-type sugar transport system permease subunit
MDVLRKESVKTSRILSNWTFWRTWPYVLPVPALLLIVLTVLYPMGHAFHMSLTQYNPSYLRAPQFIGLANYTDLLRSGYFWATLFRTLIFTLGVVTITFVFGLGLAILANKNFIGRGLLRTCLLIPWAIPPVAAGVMWSWIFSGSAGVLNGLLYKLGLMDHYISWLRSPWLAMAAVIYARAWRDVSLTSLLFLSGLTTIPNELYDASQVDGAGSWRAFWHITLPLLRPIGTVILILETTTAIRAFPMIYTITGGGPGDATTVIGWQTYTEMFKYLNFGRGAALAYLLTIITGILAIIYIRFGYRRTQYL